MNLFNRKTLKRHIKADPIPSDHLAALEAWAELISSGRIERLKETALYKQWLLSLADAASTIAHASWSISSSVKSAGVTFADTNASLRAWAFDLYFAIDPLAFPSDSMRSAKWATWLIGFGRDRFAREVFVFINLSFSWLKVVLMPDHQSGRSRDKDRSTLLGQSGHSQ